MMPVAPDRGEDPAAASLQGRAADDLRYIRQAMERSTTFTAVPGVGGVVMGGIGLAAALVASRQPSAERWIGVWLVAAAVAATLGVIAIRRKAAAGGVPLTGAVGRRFAVSLSAPLFAGAALTFGAWLHGAWSLMPSVWLLLYGTGVLMGSAYSVAPLRPLGLAFMALGVAALVTPAGWGNIWLALGFGALQVGFGLYIARVYGG